MQLRTARMCLDCEEIHEDQQCPVCASEAFAYLTRWVTVEERRARRRPIAPTINPENSGGLARWTQRGAIGLAIVAASRWLWQSSRPAESQAEPPGQSDRRAKVDGG